MVCTAANWAEISGQMVQIFVFFKIYIFLTVSNIYPSKYGWTESLTLPPWKHFSVFCGIVTRSQNNISLHTLDEYNVRTGLLCFNLLFQIPVQDCLLFPGELD